MPSSSLSARQPSSRNHSHAHSYSLGAINPSHRVTRRKSMTSAAATNVAAMVAAIHEAPESSYTIGTPSNRRSMTLNRGLGFKGTEPTSVGGTSGASDYPLSDIGTAHVQASNPAVSANFAAGDDSAVADDMPSSGLENNGTNNKGRGRRASEGAHLVKGGGKRISGGELRCDQCGKGYKHSSCLTKHLSVPRMSHPPQTLPHEHDHPLLALNALCAVDPGLAHLSKRSAIYVNLTMA